MMDSVGENRIYASYLHGDNKSKCITRLPNWFRGLQNCCKKEVCLASRNNSHSHTAHHRICSPDNPESVQSRMYLCSISPRITPVSPICTMKCAGECHCYTQRSLHIKHIFKNTLKEQFYFVSLCSVPGNFLTIPTIKQ